MNDYVIYTDSSCDLSKEKLAELDVKCLELTFIYDDEEKVYLNYEVSAADFYAKMREGTAVKTSAVNFALIKEALQAELEKGNDVLYITFSSGLSTTFNCVGMAKNELSEAYPERKITVVDSLSASGGMAMLVLMAAEAKKAGKTAEEVAEEIEAVKLKVDHWFTVDDLKYLKKGGRIGTVKAVVGDILKIKPILIVNSDGKLESVSKCRGRKHAIKFLCDKIEEAGGTESPKIIISHGDSSEDAKLLEAMIKEKYGRDTDCIIDIGPVIGAHAGPGTLALFFIGNER